MSYFGHLFLKFNKEADVYFSRTIAFLAPIESDESMLSITVAGAFSSIRGLYQIAPYHQIISQYIEEDQLACLQLPQLQNFFLCSPLFCASSL
jgi:hypothetical protein